MLEAETTSKAAAKHRNCFGNPLFNNLIAVESFLIPDTNVLPFNFEMWACRPWYAIFDRALEN
jgi:hypothetical protein